MLITDVKRLERFKERHWQGIPSVEKTAGGRLFAAWYSGGLTEQLGNFVVVARSDDDGATWETPVCAAYGGESLRCFDPCLWTDPDGRLWLFWNVQPEYRTYAAVCANPDEGNLVWSDPFVVGAEVMMNKPAVLANGDWLLPIAVWDKGIYAVCELQSDAEDRRAFVYRSRDKGKTFERLGGVTHARRTFDEHMIVERKNGELYMLLRTKDNLYESVSEDGGQTWSAARDSGIRSPSSRFYLGKLRSGNWILVTHDAFVGRNNLTAMLSEDEGGTWTRKLLLDERDLVSYPDLKQDADGWIYVIYDRERGNGGDVRAAREILAAKFREEDIVSGKISEGGYVKRIVDKL